MEKTVRTLDYEKYDQMVQVHDYAGVNFLGGRDANQKAAASEATKIFQDYYPEFLVRSLSLTVHTYPDVTGTVHEVLHQRSNVRSLDLLVLQVLIIVQDLREDERCWPRRKDRQSCSDSRDRREGIAEALRWRG